MTASSSKPSSADTAKQIRSLLKELPEERADAARLDELRRVLGRLVTSGDLTFSSAGPSSEIASKWNTFLQKQHRTMVSQICQRIKQQGRRTAVRTMWGVIAASPMAAQNQVYSHVHPDLMYQWIRSMVSLDLEDKTLRHMVEQEFLVPYRDVQYYALGAIARLAGEGYAASIKQEEAERLLQLLLMVPIPTSQEEMDNSNYLFPPPKHASEEGQEENSDSESSDEEEDSSSDDDSDSSQHEEEVSTTRKRKRDSEKTLTKRSFAFQQLKSHRKAHSNAWLAVLKLPLPTRALKNALQFLPSNVLSNVPNPLLFADFFIQAYNSDSVGNSSGFTSLLALDGLFCLMTQHGLEHQRFYESLYSQTKSRMLYAKHRTRFLELLTKCLLRNEMLPALIVAAFCKRLLRSSLSAPPSGALFCIALCANLLRQHPECACLIHRRGTELTDVYDAKTNDPSKSRALESSLWELSALSQHYYPAVAALAKSVGTEDANTPLHNMDDFLRHTYKSLFKQERKRAGDGSKKRQKQLAATPLTFVEPKGLFTSNDVFANMLDVPKAEEKSDE